MEKLLWILVGVFFAAFAISRTWYYFFTSRDELYSYYRNRIDISERDFKRRLIHYRIIWALLSVSLSAVSLYLLFS